MKSLGLIAYGLAIGAAAAMLASCGGSSPSTIVPRALSENVARPMAAYSSLYSFQAKPDGEYPVARLIPFNNVLYGTTSIGGTGCGNYGCGTVFKITTTGTETVLHRFKGVPDGAEPLTELAVVRQELYGTTNIGGTHCRFHKVKGCGTVYSIDASGTERVVYRFKGLPDGAAPNGPLTLVGGTLYGTTTSGGAECADVQGGCGTVYSIDSNGNEKVLHRFTGEPDGAEPNGNLVSLDGNLYGTTPRGGSSYNAGTVFVITPSGSERVLYSGSVSNGTMYSPSGLVAMGGMLYGSSAYGGKSEGGTIYAITTSGDIQILHSFQRDYVRNGEAPLGRLIAVNGILYGTTSAGGKTHQGYGLVYSITASGAFKVLYRFKGPPDGAYPAAGISDAKGTFYGTTTSGGTTCYRYGCAGYGTVFRLAR